MDSRFHGNDSGGWLATKDSPPIIRATCTNHSKIYKIVGSLFAVSHCVGRDRTFFQLFYFWFRVPAVFTRKLGGACPTDPFSARCICCQRDYSGASPTLSTERCREPGTRCPSLRSRLRSEFPRYEAFSEKMGISPNTPILADSRLGGGKSATGSLETAISQRES